MDIEENMSYECDKCGDHRLPCESYKQPPPIKSTVYKLMNWIGVKEELPGKQTERYLIKTKCHHFAHNCLAWNYPNPCGEINIAYYDDYARWYYESGVAWDSKVEVTHWMYLPKPPVE